MASEMLHLKEVEEKSVQLNWYCSADSRLPAK